MDKIKIEIVKLGESKHASTIDKLKKISKNSKLFEITNVKKVNLPDTDGYFWSYSDAALNKLFPKKTVTTDIQLGIIDYPLEGNFFGRELSNSIGVISFHETDVIFNEANLDLINFVLLTIYQAIVLFACNSSILDGEEKFYHDESRGCIFDMCGIKTNIIQSASKPIICYDCEAKMRKKVLNEDFVSQLRRELRNIKKPLYYRITDWIKKHPIWSLIITLITSLVINVISNVLYDLFMGGK